MGNIGQSQQTSLERRKYTVSYDRFLDPSDAIFDHVIAVSPNTDPILSAEDSFTTDDDRELTFYLKGGVPGQIYNIKMIATLTDGQIKDDNLQVGVV